MRPANCPHTHLPYSRVRFERLLWLCVAVGLLPTVSIAQDEPAEAADTPRVDVTTSDGSAIPWSRVMWHLPDPARDYETAMRRVEVLREQGEENKAKFILRILEIAEPIRRESRIELSLEEALHRALSTNYAIEVQRYNPAVETTRVVEAESAFDAIFFINLRKNNIDRPSASALQATDVDMTNLAIGLRKTLPTGATISGSWELDRTRTTLEFQTINPEYKSGLVLEMRQPLLRNFGIDVNRSVILLRQNDRRISRHAFHRQVRDVLRQTEEAYWRLVEARHDVVVSARLLAQFEQILAYLDARRDFDVIPVQLAATQANLQQERAAFVRRVANVFDAEDRLVALMNSEDVDLADDVEILPTDFPSLTRLTLDPMAELQTGLDNRPELREQELRVASAKVAVGQAKSAELPRFDLTFRADSSGLAISADRAFDESTSYNFVTYFVGLEFEIPVGNRGPRAQYKRSQLLHDQQVAALKRTFEEVILDINLAVREIDTTYNQIGPAYEAAEARLREVESIVARAERKDINTLNSELRARTSLADSRRGMVRVMAAYNIAIIDLERAKGTLLRYNNVVLPFDED